MAFICFFFSHGEQKRLHLFVNHSTETLAFSTFKCTCRIFKNGHFGFRGRTRTCLSSLEQLPARLQPQPADSSSQRLGINIHFTFFFFPPARKLQKGVGPRSRCHIVGPLKPLPPVFSRQQTGLAHRHQVEFICNPFDSTAVVKNSSCVFN